MPFIRFYLICVYTALMYAPNSVRSNFHTCENGNSTQYLTSVDLASAGFPKSSSQMGCKCDIIAPTGLNVILKVLIVKQPCEDSKFPLTINYTMDGTIHTVNNLKKIQLHWFESSGMVIAQNSSDVTIDLKQTGANDTRVEFVFHIRTLADVPEQITVYCQPDIHEDNDTSNIDNESKESDVLDYIQHLCSAHLVILLGSLSAALLVIILIVSIILCCVIPKKQREEIAKLRKSMVLDRESHIYENAIDEDPNRATSLNWAEGIPMEGRLSEYVNSNTGIQQRQFHIYKNSPLVNKRT